MKLGPSLRSPCHARHLVRPGGDWRLSNASLSRMLVVTEVSEAILAAARGAVDRLHGEATAEGRVALALSLTLAIWLTARLMAWIGTKAATAGSMTDGENRDQRR
jgi:hypothetical protein